MYIRKKEHQIQFFRRKQKFLMTFRQTKRLHTLHRNQGTELLTAKYAGSDNIRNKNGEENSLRFSVLYNL